ncbi:MAG: preprotein translocase subunit SecA [Atopobium sp.]|uniref:Protein translocase subunit SecA n=2 Tax=Lancefieldella parvula TaxID=1382 RepID=A0A9D5X4K5_9ACTN|nr:preprotein translocase subunit SecA [Atopobium sp.]MBF4802607.1 preprotein translocase subunit SecA [Lancefieldella parvula]MBF0894929.1 preprotein translocase subunit SecA [Atopobium sp.]MBF0895838.1 preprotein translocase subunit SecA [Atopobium sp.]MBF0915920.1 preprotein translocase subunit SecA [Atopobium sp.]
MPNFLSKILSFGADKDLKAYQRIVEKINALEPTMQEMSDEELQAQTEKFKARYAEGESLDDLLPEAFATVREASVRTIGQRHFDVQLIGGIALHKGTIAEMKTGEGKTLVSTLAGYLNALSGEGVHIVTVNDYLAKRDSEWMGTIYKFLGISVGLLQNGMRLSLKKPAYEADITYGTNSEFGFDYLRDNMVTRPEMRVQRGHHYAIVDEVDSILIDEARTPLIISGAGTKSAGTYKDFAKAVRGLTPDVDFEMDEAKHTIATTEIGLEKVERALNIDDIYNDETGQLVNHLQQALKAEYMFHRDQQYVVIDGEVKIVDEFTGRIMEGRRYSEGLHQAIEAKENVQVREENQTLATITLQNYFLMYDKLSGMTGTAMTEDAEFREVYHVPVQVIPPNRPVKREDLDDLVYRTIDAKFEAVVRDVEERHQNGQPVLVGTVSIDNSERISRILSKRGIKHNVLNAKFHEREAQIIAQAGREGAVTIATNMAGRGTDILLGGNPDVMAEDILRNQGIEPAEATQEQKEAARKEAKEICATEREAVTAAGGLCVIGTERHESRRIDNQLRGRSGRQGDPGQTQFYLSLEDDLMRRFGGDRMDGVAAMMQRYELPDDMPIKAKIVTKLVEGAQRKVEEVNFAMRKNVLDYDDVMNKQRQVIYAERNKILDGKDLMELIETVTASTTQRICEEFCYGDADEWDLEGLEKWLTELTGKTDLPEFTEDTKFEQLEEDVTAFVQKTFDEKTQKLGEEVMRELAAQVMLRVIDTRWMAYLQEMDYLKTGIGLRGFGQRDPLVEYKTEAYEAFTLLVNTMYEDFLRTILRLELVNRPRQNTEAEAFQNAHYSGGEETDGDQKALKQGKSMLKNAAAIGKSPQGTGASQSSVSTYRKSDDPNPYVNVGRNDPCPCGSGKKFKNCHGRNR